MSESCACQYSCSSGKLSWGSLQLQQRGPHRGMGPASLGMQRQRADSQIRCDRERRCSRRTPGRPPASLWGSRCPSSPRRRSSQRGEGERRKRRQAERRKVKVQQQDSIYVGLICVFQEDSRWGKKSSEKKLWREVEVRKLCHQEPKKKEKTLLERAEVQQSTLN